MGTEIIEEDIPVEQEDLIPEILLAYNIYSLLAPKFDSFNGGYFGKDYSNLKTLFDMYEVSVQEQKEYFKIILILDSIDTEQINNRLKNRPAQSN
jgi:hypothetical protein